LLYASWVLRPGAPQALHAEGKAPGIRAVRQKVIDANVGNYLFDGGFEKSIRHIFLCQEAPAAAVRFQGTRTSAEFLRESGIF